MCWNGRPRTRVVGPEVVIDAFVGNLLHQFEPPSIGGLPMNRRFVFALIVALLASSPALAQQKQWDREKGDCERVFQSSKTVVIAQLKQCVGRWLAYIDPNLIKPKQKQALKNTFQDLYNRGMNKADEEAEYLSTAAAERLNVRLKLKLKRDVVVRRPGGNDNPENPGGATASKRPKFVPRAVGSKDQARARKLVAKGVKLFRKGKRKAAMGKYMQALELDPGNLDALFNYAAELAHRKDGAAAVEQLRRLQDIGTKPALKRLAQSRIDPDFKPIRDFRPYKIVSGFARIKLVNSIGEFGEDEIERIEKTLGKLKHPVEEIGIDKQNGRRAPFIWFKDHAAPTAYLIKKVVIHPGTTLTKITWNTDYDIIVSWGNKIVKKDGVKQPAKDYTDVSPADGEKRLDDLLREEDKILREPERAARKVDHVIATPERVERKVDSSVDRVERTVDTIEKTGDKIKNIFK